MEFWVSALYLNMFILITFVISYLKIFVVDMFIIFLPVITCLSSLFEFRHCLSNIFVVDINSFTADLNLFSPDLTVYRNFQIIYSKFAPKILHYWLRFCILPLQFLMLVELYSLSTQIVVNLKSRDAESVKFLACYGRRASTPKSTSRSSYQYFVT